MTRADKCRAIAEALSPEPEFQNPGFTGMRSKCGLWRWGRSMEPLNFYHDAEANLAMLTAVFSKRFGMAMFFKPAAQTYSVIISRSSHPKAEGSVKDEPDYLTATANATFAALVAAGQI